MQLIVLLFMGVLLVAGCSSPNNVKDAAPKKPTRVDRAEVVIPKVEPKSKYGNPKSYVVFGKRYHTLSTSKGYVEEGIASWYGTKFHGRRTSSGEVYDMYAMTAAHKTVPLPTYARVTNKKNGRSIIVRINDRGPFHENRIIDLSYAAATKLGIVTSGTGLVEVRAIDPRTSRLASENSKRKKPALPEGVVDVAAPDSGTANKASSVEIIEPDSNAATTGVSNTTPSASDIENDIGIYVQLGAFRSKENAYKLRNQFAAHQLGQVGVKQEDLTGTPIYKVRIGPLDTVEQADSTTAKLNELGHKEYKLVFQEKP